MAKKKAVKGLKVVVPESLEKVTDFIRQIGEHRRVCDQVEIVLNVEIEKLKAQAVRKTGLRQEAIDKLFEEIYSFAKLHRSELTQDGKKKTVKLPTGSFRWRTAPAVVSLEDEEKVIAQCKSLGFERFIRTTEHVDKKAMLGEEKVSADIEGVEIKKGKEFFVVEPSGVSAKISKGTEELKKVLPREKK